MPFRLEGKVCTRIDKAYLALLTRYKRPMTAAYLETILHAGLSELDASKQYAETLLTLNRDVPGIHGRHSNDRALSAPFRKVNCFDLFLTC